MLINLLIGAGLLSSSCALSKDAEAQIRRSQINFYKVQLVCPAAPHIGCGSASKPVLLGLEGDPLVKEAWLNRAGTVMAVVWKNKSTAATRMKIVSTRLEQQNIRELKGEARAQALKGFLAGTGWYRGAEVDRLSEEEAEIMASRLVRKMQKVITLTDAKIIALERPFAEVLARKLTKGESQEQTEAALMRICQEHLDEKDIAILHEAHQKGAFSNLRND